MISGINSYGASSFGWYNAASMNDFKLSQALSGKNLGSGVSAIPGVGSTLSNSAASFLKDYKTNMTSLQKLAAQLSSTNQDSTVSDLAVTSGDSGILTASSSYKLAQEAAYTVNVKQLAASQVNTSSALQDSGAPAMAAGSFSLSTSVGEFSFDIDPSEATSNQDLLTAVADAVNGLKTGVTAKVVNDRGRVSLSLTSSETGAGTGFAVSGDFARSIGLDQVSRQAQDAVYTVDKQGDSLGPMEFTSAENTVNIGTYKIQAQLKGTGSTQVSVGTDMAKMTDNVDQLIKQYNKTLSFLGANSSMGVGVLKQQRNMILPPTSERSMNQVGISVNKDGTLAFDKAKFAKAAAADPALVKDVISGSHGLAQGILQDTRTALSASSASLVGKDVFGASQNVVQQGQNYDKSQFAMLSTYSRSGVYNMTNYYAVGMLMNFNI